MPRTAAARGTDHLHLQLTVTCPDDGRNGRKTNFINIEFASRRVSRSRIEELILFRISPRNNTGCLVLPRQRCVANFGRRTSGERETRSHLVRSINSQVISNQSEETFVSFSYRFRIAEKRRNESSSVLKTRSLVRNVEMSKWKM